MKSRQFVHLRFDIAFVKRQLVLQAGSTFRTWKIPVHVLCRLPSCQTQYPRVTIDFFSWCRQCQRSPAFTAVNVSGVNVLVRNPPWWGVVWCSKVIVVLVCLLVRRSVRSYFAVMFTRRVDKGVVVAVWYVIRWSANMYALLENDANKMLLIHVSFNMLSNNCVYNLWTIVLYSITE